MSDGKLISAIVTAAAIGDGRSDILQAYVAARRQQACWEVTSHALGAAVSAGPPLRGGPFLKYSAYLSLTLDGRLARRSIIYPFPPTL